MTVKIGNRVLRAREARDWTQVELARRSGVSPSYLSRLEDGAYRRPSHDKLRALADALGVTVSDLTDEPVDTASRDALRQLLERRFGPDAELVAQMVDRLAPMPPDARSLAIEVADRLIATWPTGTRRPQSRNRTSAT